MTKERVLIVAFVAASLVASSARAADEPAYPFSLPDLTHRATTLKLETIAGSLTSSSGTHSAGVERITIERPILPAFVYLGGTMAFAGAEGPGGAGTKQFVSNVAIDARVVWSQVPGIVFDVTGGVFIPTANVDSSSANDASLAVISLLPWDLNMFRVSPFAMRSAFDARVLIGDVTLQLREGLEWSPRPDQAPRSNVTTMTTLFAGVTAWKRFAPGLEIGEAYLLDSGIPDEHRSAFIVSPGLRFFLGRVQPEIAALASLGDTLHPEVNRVWGVRIGATFVVDR